MMEEKYIELITIADDTYLANKYLDAGWVLLNVCTGHNNSSGEDYHSLLLGWPAGCEVNHPKDDRGYGLG